MEPFIIQLVDDEPANLDMLSQILKKEGYKVRVSINGYMALVAARENQPDLMLLDVLLPDISGYEVCEYLKADERTRDIPVIFLSGLFSPEDKIKGFECGGVDYITKPFYVKEVVVRVSTHLALRSAQKYLEMQNARLQSEIQERTESLRKSENYFRNIFENSNDAIFIHDATGKITDVNPMGYQILGYPKEKLIGKMLFDLHPKKEQEVGKQFFQHFKQHGSVRFESKLQHADGRIIDVEINASICDPDENMGCGMIRDITARKEYEKKLHLFRTVVKASCEAIAVSDSQGKLVYINPAYEKLFGRSLEETVDCNYRENYPPESIEILDKVVSPALHRGESWEGILDAFDRRGRRFPLWQRRGMIADKHGNMLFDFGFMHDDTQRIRAEHMLKKRNMQLENFFQIGLEITAELDLDKLLHSIASRALKLFNGRSGGIILYFQNHEPLEFVETEDTFFIEKIDENLDDKIDCRDMKIPKRLNAMTIAPICWREQLLGMLTIDNDLCSDINEEDAELLSMLATQAAIGIRNAQMFEQIKRDAETKSQLLREVNHRVANNLTAISGLLSIKRAHLKTSEQAVYREIMTELTNRINSLGKVHFMLSRSNWQPLSLEKLADQVIHSSLSMLPSEKRISVETLPSPVCVTAKQAHHLALIMNELTINTIKYAMKDREIGRIKVWIEQNDNVIQFTFQDDGPGYPEDVLRMERFNVGIDLIQQLTCRDLRGKLSLSNSNGAVTIIRLP